MKVSIGYATILGTFLAGLGILVQAMSSPVPTEESTLSVPRADINNVDADQGDSGQ